jgi:hypothetical protein
MRVIYSLVKAASKNPFVLVLGGLEVVAKGFCYYPNVLLALL